MSKPLKVGRSYPTRDGKAVKIVKRKEFSMLGNRGMQYCDCVKGEDGLWRHNRESDRGRVTGSEFDTSDPNDLIPEK